MFDGETFDKERDGKRLWTELAAVRQHMLRSDWRTLAEVAGWLGYPEASVSARLRDLRKAKFGGWNVERRYVSRGLWEYRLAGKKT